jgi:Flp pilus assembly protein TadG
MTMRLTRGIAMIEFALVLPLILLFIAGILDYTLLLRSAIATADAARVGAQYGSANSLKAADITGMQTAALNAGSNIPGLTATASRVCQCSDGVSVTCSSGRCSSGMVQVYVQVTAQTTVTPIFSYTPLPFSGAVSSTTKMRAR